MKSIIKAASVALALTFTTGTAQADEASLACAVNAVSDPTRSAIADFAYDSSANTIPDTVYADLRFKAAACAATHQIPETLRQPYLEYTFAALLMPASVDAMTSAGLPVAVVNRALNVGPTIRDFNGQPITEEEVETLIAALEAAGYSTASIQPRAWQTMGVYLGAARTYYEMRPLLN